MHSAFHLLRRENRARPRHATIGPCPIPTPPPRSGRRCRPACSGSERAAPSASPRRPGIDDALESATEEAIVRALESPAVERAIVRVLESDAAQDALQRTLSSPAVERAAAEVLDSELVDHVWDQLLDSDEAQKLIERIAEAPELRAAIASQGVGLLRDIGRQIRDLAMKLDDGLERIFRRLIGRPRREPTQNIGLVTRSLAMLIDGVILNGIFLLTAALLGFVVSASATPTASRLRGSSSGSAPGSSSDPPTC